MSLYLPCPPVLSSVFSLCSREVSSVGECRKEGDRVEERLGWGLHGGISIWRRSRRGSMSRAAIGRGT